MADETQDMKILYERIFRSVVKKLHSERFGRPQELPSLRKSSNLEDFYVEALRMTYKDHSRASLVVGTIMDSYRSGYDVTSVLLDLKRMAGLPDKEKTVRTGEHAEFSLVRDDRVFTGGLEQCVAVLTIDGLQGTLSHLTVKQDPEDFITWLRPIAGDMPRAYLFGGRKSDSESYLRELYQQLKKIRCEVIGGDVLMENTQEMDVTLLTSGVVQSRKYRKFVRPDDNKRMLTNQRYFG